MSFDYRPGVYCTAMRNAIKRCIGNAADPGPRLSGSSYLCAEGPRHDQPDPLPGIPLEASAKGPTACSAARVRYWCLMVVTTGSDEVATNSLRM